MKKEITIDEWIYHYLRNEDTYEQTDNFLRRVYKRCDVLVVRYGSPLSRKIFKLAKESQYWNQSQRQAIKSFMRQFVYNSDKMKIIYKAPPIGEKLKQKLPHKDIYLVETALVTDSKFVLTTDRELCSAINKLKDELGIDCSVLEDFLSEYIKESNYI